MPEHNLHSIAFPRLDEVQIAGLTGCTAATPRFFRDGQTLFAIGDHDFNFFIVKSGEIEIVDHSGNAPKTVTILLSGAHHALQEAESN
jgi:thioredoxin reductase (NADPH)